MSPQRLIDLDRLAADRCDRADGDRSRRAERAVGRRRTTSLAAVADAATETGSAESFEVSGPTEVRVSGIGEPILPGDRDIDLEASPELERPPLLLTARLTGGGRTTSVTGWRVRSG